MKAKDILEKIMGLKLRKGERIDFDSITDIEAATGENMTAMEAILLAQVKRAIEKADKSSAEFIFKLTGDLTEQSKVEVKSNNPFAGMSTVELQKLANLPDPIDRAEEEKSEE